jgi:hypothetical protein
MSFWKETPCPLRLHREAADRAKKARRAAKTPREKIHWIQIETFHRRQLEKLRSAA